MSVTNELAQRVRYVYSGYNWSDTNLKTQLADCTLEEIHHPILGSNTIAQLAFHIFYYVGVQIRVLEGGPLTGNDALSWETPKFKTQEEWDSFLQQCWREGAHFAQLIENMPPQTLWSEFDKPRYKTFYYNLTGLVEHLYYHLGQIVLIKKVIRSQDNMDKTVPI